MTLVIWINSSFSSDLSSSQSGYLVNILSNVLNVFNIEVNVEMLTSFVRTTAHFGEFYVLGVFWGYYLLSVKKPIKYLLFAVLLTAILDECVQLFSEGRAFELFDIGIDGLGGIFSLTYFKIISKL
jgi:VanZ family protein